MTSSNDISLHPKTQEFIQQNDVEQRKLNGQYFTPPQTITDLLTHIPDTQLRNRSELNILDIAAGTGEFLRVLQRTYPNASIEGWEIDTELATISRQVTSPAVEIENVNSLQYDPNKKYDLIVGNPPYYELKQATIDTEKLRQQYSEVVYGRTNIYALFIYKAIRLLKNNGFIAFIVPPSMNNGAYFKKLREYIRKTCSIKHLSVYSNPDIFDGVSHPVMYLVLQKTTDPSDDYVFEKNGITIFSEEAEYLDQQFTDKQTLSEIGYTVSTGRVVWTDHKNALCNTPKSNTVPLIWTKNIQDGTLEIHPDAHTKPQYISSPDYEPKTGPALVVNRLVGKPGQGIIKAAYVKNGFEFLAENHVNVVQPDPSQQQQAPLKKILSELNNSTSIEIVQTITGNHQLSTTELQHLFPIQV